ncbi:MAG: DNA gyrase subunit A [Planctomycetia bacterium]
MTAGDAAPLPSNIHDLDIAQELKTSYLRYAMSVIVDRALPDVRDGLKPSQRRILVAMNDLGLTPSKKTLKCAKVVGETMGNYHPHGDQAIYPTLVRMAQAWNMGAALVHPQGNFGSVDGDPPASMRYTECRMTAAAVDMLADLDQETVDFQPNYDESRLEPKVLPGMFPNLLVNGGSGIAVAMASSMAPHNVGEVCSAILAYLRDPAITLEGLMQHLPGPDFPTGGRICGKTAILEAYATGRAILEVRARCEIVENERGGAEIIVTEIPYQVNRANLVKKIGELKTEDKVPGIADLRDESDESTRIWIKLKRGEDPNVVLNQLYRYSQLKDSFSVNAIALIDGRPVLCGLKRLIEEYVRHRRVVIVRRSRFQLRKAEERDHVVEGLLKALDLIDAIVALIRASADTEAARAGLMARFAFTHPQAEAILQMRLSRLTGLQRKELEDEHAQLQARIAELKAILADDAKVLALIAADLEAIRARYGQPRRSSIEEAQGEIIDVDLVTPENVAVTFSHAGYVKRTSLTEYRLQNRGGKGIIGTEAKDGDFAERLLVANTRDWLLLFTDRGRVHKEQVFALPELGRYAQGRALINYVPLEPGEKIRAVLPISDLSAPGAIVFATRKGQVKRTLLSDFQNIHRGGIIAIQLRDGDELISTCLADEQDEIVLVSAQGKSIRFALSEVRAMGRDTTGVRGIHLLGDDHVVAMERVDEKASLLCVFERGQAKRSAFAEYPPKGRAGQGVQNCSHEGLERNGPIVAAKAVLDGDEVILITHGGQAIRTTVTPEQFRLMGRATGGVRAIDVPEGDRLVSMAWVRPSAAEQAAAAGEAGAAG